MSGKAGVVVIDGVRGDAVDKGALGRGGLQGRNRSAGTVMRDAETARCGTGHRLVPARDHASDAVGEAEPHRFDGLGGQHLVAQGGDKAGGAGVKDPGAKDTKKQGGGQKMAGAEGIPATAVIGLVIDAKANTASSGIAVPLAGSSWP